MPANPRKPAEPYRPFGPNKKSWATRKAYLDALDRFVLNHPKWGVNKSILRFIGLHWGPSFTRMIDNSPGGPKIYHDEVMGYLIRHEDQAHRVHIGPHRILYKSRDFTSKKVRVIGPRKAGRILPMRRQRRV